MWVYLPYIPKLPSEYQEVEYITFTGTQYIDTPYIANYNSEFYCKITVTATWSSQTPSNPIFNPRTANNTNWYSFWCQLAGTFWDDANNAAFNWLVHTGLQAPSAWQIVEFQMSKTWWRYNNQTWTWSPSSWSPNVRLLIWAVLSGTTIDSNRKFHWNMYSFKIWENWTLLYDFVPCYRKSDSVIWLYDLVNNQFYTNSWSGTFSKWADVVMTELKNAYIGEVKEYSIDFRWNTQSWIEADGWAFTKRTGSEAWSFDTSWLKLTSSSQLFVNRVVDLTNAKKISMIWTGYLANKSGTWDGGLFLDIWQATWDFYDDSKKAASVANRNVWTTTAHKWYRLVYNGTSYSTWTALSAGEYIWTLNIDLETWDISWKCNELSLSWTLTSTYLWYLKSSQRMWVILDNSQHIIHTLNVEIDY